MRSVKENLIAAKALIDTPEKWLKGKLANADGCFCAAGALKYAAGYGAGEVWDSPEYRAVRGGIPDTKQEIPSFNDRPSTTHADIMALFDRAIAAQGDA